MQTNYYIFKDCFSCVARTLSIYDEGNITEYNTTKITSKKLALEACTKFGVAVSNEDRLKDIKEKLGSQYTVTKEIYEDEERGMVWDEVNFLNHTENHSFSVICSEKDDLNICFIPIYE